MYKFPDCHIFKQGSICIKKCRAEAQVRKRFPRQVGEEKGCSQVHQVHLCTLGGRAKESISHATFLLPFLAAGFIARVRCFSKKFLKNFVSLFCVLIPMLVHHTG